MGSIGSISQVIFLKSLITKLDSSKEIQLQTEDKRFLPKYANSEKTENYSIVL